METPQQHRFPLPWQKPAEKGALRKVTWSALLRLVVDLPGRALLYAGSLILLLSFTTSDESDWKIERSEDGITIKTRKQEGIDLKQYEAEMQLETFPEKVKQLIMDIENYPTCMDGLYDSETLKRSQDTILMKAYQKTPWPAKDRVFAAELVFTETENGFRADMKARPELIMQNPKYIIVPQIKGFWEVKKINQNQCQVRQRVLAHPGGSVPTWMANLFIANTPFNTFKAIKEQLEN